MFRFFSNKFLNKLVGKGDNKYKTNNDLPKN